MPIGHTALFPGLNKWPKLLGVSDSSFWTCIYETMSVYGYVLGQPKNKDCSKKASYSQWQAKFSFSTFFAEPVTLLRTKISPGSCANITLHTYPRKRHIFANAPAFFIQGKMCLHFISLVGLFYYLRVIIHIAGTGRRVPSNRNSSHATTITNLGRNSNNITQATRVLLKVV